MVIYATGGTLRKISYHWGTWVILFFTNLRLHAFCVPTLHSITKVVWYIDHYSTGIYLLKCFFSCPLLALALHVKQVALVLIPWHRLVANTTVVVFWRVVLVVLVTQVNRNVREKKKTTNCYANLCALNHLVHFLHRSCFVMRKLSDLLKSVHCWARYVAESLTESLRMKNIQGEDS